MFSLTQEGVFIQRPIVKEVIAAIENGFVKESWVSSFTNPNSTVGEERYPSKDAHYSTIGVGS